MNVYLFRFPWPKGGSVNHIYRRTGTGITLSAAAVAWKEECGLTVRQSLTAARAPLGYLGEPGAPWVWAQAELWYRPPTEGRHDVDNLFKLTLDAIAAGAQLDDSLFWRVSGARLPLAAVTREPFLLVRLSELTKADVTAEIARATNLNVILDAVRDRASTQTTV